MARSKGNEISTLKRAIASLVGKSCWSIVAGRGTGSMATLAFGRRIQRSHPLKNPTLTPDEQNFDGEISLFLKDAAWRLDDSSGPICSSTDSNESGGAMLTGLRNLLNKKVDLAKIVSPAGDLTIRFDGGMTLFAFCVQTNVCDEEDNYCVFTLKRIIVVGPKGQIATQVR